jgi:hypothetical protein
VKKKRMKYTPEMDEIIRTRYPDEPVSVVANALGITNDQCRSRAAYIGVRQSEDVYKKRMAAFVESGIPNRAGNVELRRDWKPGDKRRKPPKEKKRKILPVGFVKKFKNGYWAKKVGKENSPNKTCWEMLHRLIWIEHNGPIPENHQVYFIDGNKDNLTIENLALISHEEALDRNRLQRYPAEIISVINTLSAFRKELENYE